VRQGDQIELIGKSGKTWGAAIKSSPKKHKDPIIISLGHKISLKTSIKLVMTCLEKHRLPQPVYLADRKSRDMLKKNIYQKG
jgi:phosphopantothenoylcysteine synthetase/decarboxylase